MNKYYKEYQWSNIFAMLRNQKRDPAVCTENFENRLVVITGATSGIGYAAARKYASAGAEILCINRNETKSRQLCESLQDEFQTSCSYLIADFSRLEDIHTAVKKLFALDQKIDVLIHNAGLFKTQKTLTENNLEMVFQVNYLSTFILNYSLMDKFKKQNSGRILYVNSEAHRFAVWGLDFDDLNWNRRRYSGLKSYGEAKTAQLLSMIRFAEIFSGTGVTINAMHPGNVRTGSGQNNGRIYKFFKRLLIDSNALPIDVAAEALYYLGVSPELDNLSGRFFNLTTEEEPAPPALDRDAAGRLWELSLIAGGLE
ncbi:MAG: SDR family NAD(P)-dependent oxidoreductase [Anaerolineales bacterium]|nr:SDR family NAD(P)-dependent oxidoreductase [Anaerolineales bacterium]